MFFFFFNTPKSKQSSSLTFLFPLPLSLSTALPLLQLPHPLDPINEDDVHMHLDASTIKGSPNATSSFNSDVPMLPNEKKAILVADRCGMPRSLSRQKISGIELNHWLNIRTWYVSMLFHFLWPLTLSGAIVNVRPFNQPPTTSCLSTFSHLQIFSPRYLLFFFFFHLLFSITN